MPYLASLLASCHSSQRLSMTTVGERERRRQGRLEDERAEGINRRLFAVGGRAVAPLLRCLGSRSACLDFLFNLSTGAVRAAAKWARGSQSDVVPSPLSCVPYVEASTGLPTVLLVANGFTRLEIVPTDYEGRQLM
jgi:hypothetical protein